MDTAQPASYKDHYADAICPPPVMPIAEWADKYRRLPEKASPEPGLWKTDRVPFMREIMEVLSPESDIEFVDLMKGTQIAGTEVGLNLVLYTIDHDPTSMMIVVPTLGMGKRFSRQRLKASIDVMPKVKAKIADERSRDSSNTMLEKDFDGGYLVIAGAESAAGLRSAPIGVLVLDEKDAYPLDVEGEGDPEQLAIKRTQNYKGRRKVYGNSTPTTEGVSRIEKGFTRGDQRYYHVPCPHCGTKQKLVWAQIKWDKRLPREQQPESVYYECIGCHEPIREHHKAFMLADGEWVPENPLAPRNRRSYHISSLYSPLGWYSWVDAVTDWLAAQGNVELLKTFLNTVLAELWKESVNNVDARALQQRAEAYPLGTVPKKGLVLIAAVDTQDDRLECFVYAVCRAEEMWLVDYAVFYGDPGVLPELCLDSAEVPEGQKSPWDELNDWLLKDWPHASGAAMNVEGYAVDTGGHYTNAVYQYVRHHQRFGAIAVKGASVGGKPILGRPKYVDIDWRGRIYKRGVQLFLVGTDTGKDTIYNRFNAEAREGPGVIHFPDSLPFEIFEQLTAEKKHRKYKKGYAVYEWVNPSGMRNEALDCLNYVLAVAQKLGLHRYSKDRWERLERSLAEIDLFSVPQGTQATKAAAKKPPQPNTQTAQEVSTW